MDGRQEHEYTWLTKEVIAAIEKELNPGGLQFSPPGSWACPQLDAALREAYRNKFPQAEKQPQYEGRVRRIVEEELNELMEARLKKSNKVKPLETWKEAKLADDPFTSIPVTELVNVGSPRPAQGRGKNRDSHSPPSTIVQTLQSQSQYTVASSSTSVSTGRGTSTLNGNSSGSPLHQRTASSPGSSPARSNPNGGSRGRRGRGSGPRSSQARGSGAHLCPYDGCGKSFQYPSKLKDHEHTHKLAKEHSCRLGSCSKSFKRLRELKAHEKINHPGHPQESHPSGSEAGDQEMTDVGGELEPVEDERKAPGRRDEHTTIEVNDTKRLSHTELHNRSSNKTPEVVRAPSSPPTPNDRGTATPGPESPPSPVSARSPPPISEQHPSSGPKSRPVQHPVMSPDPALPVMSNEEPKSSPESRRSSPEESPTKLTQGSTRRHIKELAIELLS